MGGFLSRRMEMACLLLSGLLILYTLRVNMSVAAQQMRVDLNWSETEKGYVLSSFYWGYVIGQIPASCIAQYYGAKWLFGWSVAVPSFLTIMVPMACHHSLSAALAIRVLIGFFESASFPAIYHFFPIWVPNSEKTFLIPFIVSGIYLGQMVGFSFSGVLAASDFYIGGDYYGGWQSVFYVFGLLGLLWFPLWIYAAYESPSVHPYISTEELQYMRSATSHGLGADRASKGVSPAGMDDNDDIECINFDNLHEVTLSSGRRKRGAGGGQRRMLRGFSFIRTAFGGIRKPAGSDASPGRSAGRYDRVSGMDVSVTGAEGNSAINQHGSDDAAPASSRGGYGVHSNERSIELSPIHGDQDGLGYDSIVTANRHNQNRGVVTAEPISPHRIGRPPPSTEALERGAGQDQDGALPPMVLNRAQDEEEMIRARIELATRTPWKEFLTHPVALVLMAANFQYGWMNFTLMSEMPSFFTDVLGFDLRSAGVLCIFPYLALFVSALCFGNFFSYLEHQRGWQVTDVRRAAQFIAYFCSGVGLILCGFANSAMEAYGFMILTLVFFGANQSGLGCVWTDIAPNYSSTLNSIGNTIGAVAGILGPIVVAACTDAWPARGEGWRVAFFITFALSCVTLTLWFLSIKAEIVPVLNSPRRLL